jgi:hypothetical protein
MLVSACRWHIAKQTTPDSLWFFRTTRCQPFSPDGNESSSISKASRSREKWRPGCQNCNGQTWYLEGTIRLTFLNFLILSCHSLVPIEGRCSLLIMIESHLQVFFFPALSHIRPLLIFKDTLFRPMARCILAFPGQSMRWRTWHRPSRVRSDP